MYALWVNPAKVGMTIDGNHYTSDGQIGVDWLGQKPASLRAWQSVTGMDSSSTLVSG